MSRFSASNHSQADVAAPREGIWGVLTDPVKLTHLTPLLARVDADGDLWTWHLHGISALGLTVEPHFTEKMTFTDQRRIDFTHQPPAGVTERTGAEGYYLLDDVAGGTHLEIKLTVFVDLPLPRVAAPAVETVMSQVMGRTGSRFSDNLLRELGLPVT